MSTLMKCRDICHISCTAGKDAGANIKVNKNDKRNKSRTMSRLE